MSQNYKYTPQSDIERAQEKRLLDAARAGDRAAMQAIYERYADAVFNLAFRLLNNYADAQDVVQDSFIKCFQCLHQYRAEAAFWSWLRTIVSTTALMRMRKHKPLLELEDAEAMLDHITSQSGMLEDGSTYAGQQQLADAIQQLPDITRVVVWLYHVEGYTHKEIAQLLDKSISFSKTRLMRGNALLRQWLTSNNSQQSDGAFNRVRQLATKSTPQTSIPRTSKLELGT